MTLGAIEISRDLQRQRTDPYRCRIPNGATRV